MKQKKSCFLFIFSVFTLSCGQPVEQDDADYKSTKQKVIINDFDAKHPGHFWLKIHSNYQNALSASTPLDELNSLNEATLNYRLLSLTRSTSSVLTNPYTVESDCTEIQVQAGKIGDVGLLLSGTLTSPTRVTTAHHGAVADNDNKMNVYFETNERINVEDSGAIWYGSEVNSSDKENPLLAHRLFSLGIDSLARKTGAPDIDYRAGGRFELRTWYDFEIDREGTILSSQQFMQNPTADHFVGKDIEFLKPSGFHPLWKDDGMNDWSNKAKFEYIPSGPFDLLGPGPFFDIALKNAYDKNDQDICPMENTDQMHLGQLMNYNIKSNKDQLAFLTSGYTSKMNSTSCVNTPKCKGENGPIITTDYQNCIETTMDAWVGSSGGGVYDKRCQIDGSAEEWEVTGKLKTSMVLKGLAHGTQAVNESATRWNEVLKYGMVEEAQEEFALDTLNISTVMGPLETEWSVRDKDYSTANEPFNPKPSQPSGDGCPGEIVDDICTMDLDESESTDGGFAPRGIAGPTLYDPATDPNAEDKNEASRNSYRNGLYSSEGGYDVVFCDGENSQSNSATVYSENNEPEGWRVGFTMMQGVMGSALIAEGTPTRVDALAPTCTPWSSSAWIHNWNWVTLSFKAISRIYDPLNPQWLLGANLLAYKHKMHLYQILSSVYEIRLVGDFYQARPPSMKNCPPNYYLNGFKYTISNADLNKARVVGVTKLICKAHKPIFDELKNSNPIPSLMEFPLLETSEHIGYEIVVPTLDEDGKLAPTTVPYSLSQNIGNPDAAASVAVKEVSTKCKNNRAAVAIVYGRDASNQLHHLSLLCANPPAGGTP